MIIRHPMKNLLILIVAAAVFLHFYPQPEVEKFYQEQKNAALNAFSEATDTSVRLKVSKVQEDLAKEYASFRKSEKKRAEQLSSTRDNITDYYRTYCSSQPKKDVKFQQNNQNKICKVITKYSKYF